MNLIVNMLFLLLQVFQLILLARVLLSWFPNIDRSNPIVRLIYDITEPVLRPIRDMLPPTAGLDLSPLIVFLVITVVMRLLLV